MSLDLSTALRYLVIVVPSLVLHEVGHASAAYAFGDDTAKRAGRLTLNPAAHVDPFGTLLLPLLLTLSGVGAFGWAKPVPVSANRLRNPRRQLVLVALAGPATNIAIALGAAFVYRAMPYRPYDHVGSAEWWVLWVGVINVALAAFNLLPIPPLDGSALIDGLLPRKWWPRWFTFKRYAMGILILVVFLLPQVPRYVFDHAISLWAHLL